MKLGHILFMLLFIPQQGLFAQSNPMSKPSILQTKVTLQNTTTSLHEIIKSIQNNYKINFSYANDLIPLEQRISTSFSQESLENVLNSIFKNTAIKYYIVGNQVVLTKEDNMISNIKMSTVSADNRVIQNDEVKNIKYSFWSSPIPIHNGPSRRKLKYEQRHRSKSSSESKRWRKSISVNDSMNTFLGDSAMNITDTLSSEDKKLVLKKELRKYSLLRMKDQGRLSIGISFSTGFSFRNLNSSSMEGQNIILQREKEKGKPAFVSSITLNYYLFPNWYACTGINFTNLGEKGTFHYSYIDDDLWGNDDANHEISYVNSYSYLGVPIGLGFKTGNKRFIILQASLVPSIWLGAGDLSREYYDYAYYYEYISSDRWDRGDMSLPVKVSYRDYNLAYYLSLQAGYTLGRVNISGGISYSSFIFSIYNKSAPIVEKNYLLSFTAGIQYRFLKQYR